MMAFTKGKWLLKNGEFTGDFLIFLCRIFVEIQVIFNSALAGQYQFLTSASQTPTGKVPGLRLLPGPLITTADEQMLINQNKAIQFAE